MKLKVWKQAVNEILLPDLPGRWMQVPQWRVLQCPVGYVGRGFVCGVVAGRGFNVRLMAVPLWRPVEFYDDTHSVMLGSENQHPRWLPDGNTLDDVRDSMEQVRFWLQERLADYCLRYSTVEAAVAATQEVLNRHPARQNPHRLEEAGNGLVLLGQADRAVDTLRRVPDFVDVSATGWERGLAGRTKHTADVLERDGLSAAQELVESYVVESKVNLGIPAD